MPHHALEIILTRPLHPAELDTICRTMPLAASHDTTRLMALVPAKTPHRAAHRLHRRLKGRLPIDVITTHYPDASGHVLLNVGLPPAAHTALQTTALRTGQEPGRLLERAVHRAFAEHTDQEVKRLEREARRLLTHTNPAHLLAAIGHALTQDTQGPTP
ncbi:hypothetical protein [Streptomyces sp. HNS054]|uniref:hypothetical protein n=1 Tax=Streptomyces sp. HNS054 TaxID=1662446 RepID=UPI00099BCF5B|nr:hypothetical protein [Streptomyces sp. HNS054]WPW23343.1 hypothetical protein UBV09_33795 [Streptomyces griseoincarnatus]